MFLAGEIFSGYPVNYALGERKKERKRKGQCCGSVYITGLFSPSLFFFTFDFPFSHLESKAGELNPSLDDAAII